MLKSARECARDIKCTRGLELRVMCNTYKRKTLDTGEKKLRVEKLCWCWKTLQQSFTSRDSPWCYVLTPGLPIEIKQKRRCARQCRLLLLLLTKELKHLLQLQEKDSIHTRTGKLCPIGVHPYPVPTPGVSCVVCILTLTKFTTTDTVNKKEKNQKKTM